ncbi:MAG TPA: N-acetyltransferase [Candidatus Mediterraneibacter faecigallinarum]|uniref:N-acetyltransferase n=1 Tax=Candidatus Mediterraneibacter faecigallinarum TaxID=2838669 RepID=A0A9D2NYK2_9FIRM|nr:N-acetyltransferase [Candidatus Mediterraneibacter faecigallinarum]
MLNIRNERESDYKNVEDITRKAFYNVYVPGCMEHYLVHIMRGHEDFIPELDFVIEVDGQTVGNIMYTKSKLTDEGGTEKEIVTFGPVSILPKYQRKGYGKMLIEHSLKRAAELGYEAVVIMGSPANYVGSGFQCCRKYNICVEKEKYPAAMLVKELKPGALDGKLWFYSDSPVMNVDEREAQAFDDGLEKMEKKWMPSQEAFYIMSHAFVE